MQKFQVRITIYSKVVLKFSLVQTFLSAANSCLLKLSKGSYAILLGYILLWGFLPAASSQAIELLIQS